MSCAFNNSRKKLYKLTKWYHEHFNLYDINAKLSNSEDVLFVYHFPSRNCGAKRVITVPGLNNSKRVL